MLTQEDILKTLRELADGVARLSRHFEKAPPSVAEPKSPEIKQAPLEAAQPDFPAAVPTPPAAPTLQASLDEAYLSQNALEEDQRATRREIERESAKLLGLRSELAKAEEMIDEANHLKENLWPDWLRAGSLAVWKEKLETTISSGNATPAAALLFAALHGYTAATKDSDLKLLHDSLREVSRRLFLWLKEIALDDYDAVETAGQWAAEINRECQSRAEVEIPALGAPATNQWMIFRPRPGVNSPDVASVQTWCVRNAQKQPVHRAEVTV
jgi:hypothetical protein